MTQSRDCRETLSNDILAPELCSGGNASQVAPCYEEPCWIVIQSRGQFGNPQNYFNRDWDECVDGFGVPGRENT